MRCLAMLLCVAAPTLAAQEPEPPPDTARAPVESVPPPPPPSPPTLEQKRFLAGLRTATRGIAQLKDGMSRMTRAGTRDSVAQRRAGRLLAGLCGSSRPTSTMVGLGKRMKSYDAVLRDFRVAIGLPVKEDTSKTTKRP